MKKKKMYIGCSSASIKAKDLALVTIRPAQVDCGSPHVFERPGRVLQEISDCLLNTLTWGINPLPRLRRCFESFDFTYTDLSGMLWSAQHVELAKLISRSDYVFNIATHTYIVTMTRKRPDTEPHRICFDTTSQDTTSWDRTTLGLSGGLARAFRVQSERELFVLE